jgi:hypothetical protein
MPPGFGVVRDKGVELRIHIALGPAEVTVLAGEIAVESDVVESD